MELYCSCGEKVILHCDCGSEMQFFWNPEIGRWSAICPKCNSFCIGRFYIFDCTEIRDLIEKRHGKKYFVIQPHHIEDIIDDKHETVRKEVRTNDH